MKGFLDPQEPADYHDTDGDKKTQGISIFAADLQSLFGTEDGAVALHQGLRN